MSDEEGIFEPPCITVKFLSINHPDLSIPVSWDDKIEDVKIRISEVIGTGSRYLRLYYDTQKLDENSQLQQYGIGAGHVLNVVIHEAQAKKRPQSNIENNESDQQAVNLVLKENPSVTLKRAKGSVASVLIPDSDEELAVSSNSFKVFITPMNGNTFTLDVEPRMTVSDLKQAVVDKMKIAQSFKVLKDITELELNNAYISDYGIEKYDNLTVVLTSVFPLYVNWFGQYGEFIIVDVEATDTIDSVKAKIQEQTDIPPAQQRLHLKEHIRSRVHLGKEIFDGTLLDHGVDHENYEIMIVRGPDRRPNARR